MVKGVNRSVIEVTDTGNKYFSKVILYVDPMYSQTAVGELSREAEKLMQQINISGKNMLRTRIKQKKRKRILLLTFSLFAIIAVTTLFLIFIL